MNNFSDTKPGLYPTLPAAEPDTRVSDACESNSRDPHGINTHLQLHFYRVIGEPDRSAYSFELLHKGASKVYHYSKVIIYRFLTIFVGLPLMLIWGLIFGTYTFAMIWILTPVRRLSQSAISESGVYIQAICDAVIAPVFRAIGQRYSSIHTTISTRQLEAVKQIQV
ncbi:unnamed protein product [Adineta ricciae]|uniref:Caveolin n=1 Tax=Adineta ricciae TaxID=249248 RepID=A0A814XS64_ADIRI|nr:unnamed protein product [Adineta ricciae]